MKDVEFDDTNPYRPPQAATASPVVEGNLVRSVYFQICAGFQLLVTQVGLLACFLDVESIVVTGPVLTVTGLFTTLLIRKRAEFWIGTLYGLSGPAISLFVLALIAVLRWNPGEAQDPVSGIALAYAIVFWPVGLFVTVRASSIDARRRRNRYSGE